MSLLEDLGAEWYDASKIVAFKACPIKYWYRYERKLVKQGGFSPELTFGIAIHKALEHVYRGDWADLVPVGPAEVHDYPSAIHEGQTMRKMFTEFLSNFPESQEYKDRTRVNGLRLLTAYVHKWRNESFQVLEIERPFALEFKDAQGKVDFYYVGRIDLIVRDEGEIRPLDHKTAGRFGEIFDGSFKINVAQTGYMRATSQVTGQPCHKAIINGLRVTSKINEEESFVRRVTTRLPEEFDRWDWEVRDVVTQIRRYRELGKWPQHENNCYAYMRECDFKAPCIQGEAQREESLIANYEVQEWEPV